MSQKRGVSIRPSDFVADTDALVGFYNSIMPDTKSYEMLQLLKSNPEGVTTSKLLKSLDLSGGQALGGIFGGISKHAHEFGISTDDIYKWEFVNGNDTYKLTEQMIRAIDETEKINEGE